MNNNLDLTLVIEAGGKSRRMGEDKALKEFLGEPLVQRLVRRLQPLGKEILIIARHLTDYPFLDIPIHTDVQPDVGALGGLLTAMRVARAPFAAVIACDMPFVNPGLLLYQWRLIREKNVDVVIPKHEGNLQPFHALYRVRTCLPAIEKAIQRGDRKAVSWLDEVATYQVSTAEILRFDPSCTAFLNLNTRRDFELAEKIAA